VKEDFPEVTLVMCDANVGFGSACNKGIAAAESDFVVIVNSDVVTDPTMIANIIEPFQDSRVGSVTGLLSTPAGTTDAFGVSIDATLAGFVRYHGAPLAATYVERPSVGAPYGALVAYRRAALDEVGVFDERFFMYGEELELGLRLLAANWRTVATAKARGSHIGGATVGVGSPRQRYLAGFGRGYTVRIYDVMRSKHALRTFATELTAAVFQAIVSRDISGSRGRVAGWLAGAGVRKRKRPEQGIELRISALESLRMRRESYWRSTRTRDHWSG
jgi:GT2 family glycosyltransferase